MADHTPGPWHRNIRPASRYPVIFTGRNTHLITAVPARGIPDDVADANHDLICAAPDMLAALRELQAWATDAMGPEGTVIPEGHPIMRARAAIMRAMGEGRVGRRGRTGYGRSVRRRHRRRVR